jgi:hypothetical protein
MSSAARWQKGGFFLLLLLAAASPLRGAEIVLLDGRILSGVSVVFLEGAFSLETGAGGSVAVPMELVRELRLGEPAEPPATAGLRRAEPQQLAGLPGGVRPLEPREALAAFGRPPARFRPSILDPAWTPVDGWSNRAAAGNPARWAKPVFDPIWRPRNAFERDWTEFRPARWARPIFDVHWFPADGFRRTGETRPASSAGR